MYWWDVFSHLVQSWHKIGRTFFGIWWDDVWWTTVISSTVLWPFLPLKEKKRQYLISPFMFKVNFCLSSPIHLTDSWSNIIFHLYCWPILFSCHRMQTILTTRLQISQKNWNKLNHKWVNMLILYDHPVS